MNSREAELVSRTEQSRARMVSCAEALAESLRTTSPLSSVRRNPLASLAASLSLGMLIGGLAPTVRARRSTNGTGDGPSAAAEILSRTLPVALPMLVTMVKKHR
jgi:hypothetical protein